MPAGRPADAPHRAGCVDDVVAVGAGPAETGDIEDPTQTIAWVNPEGGAGPNEAGM
jgi:hypothetical protein